MASAVVSIGITSTLQGGEEIFLLGEEQEKGRVFIDMNDEALHERLLRLKSLEAVCIKPKMDSNALVVKSKNKITKSTVDILSMLFGSVFDCNIEFVDELSVDDIFDISQEQNLDKICPRRKR